MSGPSTEVGPGVLAFLVFFFLAVVLWLLMRSMFTRLRRMNLAQRSEEQRRAREAEPGPAPEASGKEEGSALGDGPEEGQGRSDEV